MRIPISEPGVFTVGAIKSWFGQETWRRGVEYHNSGAVLFVEFETEEDLWFSEVEGSRSNIYEVEIPRTAKSAYDASCTCPVGPACKHVTAALLQIINEGETSAALAMPPIISQSSRLVTAWLAEVSAAAEAPPRVICTPVVEGLDLRFLLRVRGPYSHPRIIPTLVYRKKNGSISKRKPKQVDYRAFFDPEIRAASSTEALGWLRRLELMSISDAAYRYSPAQSTSDLQDMAPLLAEIAKAGKLYYEDIQLPALRFEEAAAIKLSWTLAVDGTQAPYLCLDDETPTILIRTDPALWFSPAKGALGYAKLDLSPALLERLASAPPLRPDDLVVAEALFDRLGVAKAYRPKPVQRKSLIGKKPQPYLVLSGVPGLSREKFRRRYGYYYNAPPLTVPALSLSFNYDGRLVPADGEKSFSFAKDAELWTLERDQAAEKSAIATLHRAGALEPRELTEIVVQQSNVPGILFLRPPEAFDAWSLQEEFQERGKKRRKKRAQYEDSAMVLSYGGGTLQGKTLPKSTLEFIAKTLPDLQRQGWEIRLHPSWPIDKPATRSEVTARLSRTGSGFLTLDFLASGDLGAFDLGPLVTEIIRLLPLTQSGNLEPGFDLDKALGPAPIRLCVKGDEAVYIEPAILSEIIRGVLKHGAPLKPFHPAEAGRYRNLAGGVEDLGVTLLGDADLLASAQKLQRLGDRDPAPAPSSFHGLLRPYQLVGYRWMRDLHHTGFGGVLADDMGLGKTIEVLAFLTDLHLHQNNPLPSLVIAPTSVVSAWKKAADAFTPDLKVDVLHGLGRHGRLDSGDPCHVYITTYALLSRDIASLREQPWAAVIADEAQAVKNPASQTAKRLRELKVELRLAVTGTPVENSLNDLWSLFDWIVPGLLGNKEQFGKLYRAPIEKEGSAYAQARLNARTKPFVLRRTKAEVELDLPPKTEIIETVPLGKEQKILYESVRLARHAEVREIISAKGVQASQISIFAALLQLRQVACDPRLLKSVTPASPGSAKFDRLFELLDALLSEGRRVIVFSQFVEMLKLIRAEVVARGWRHQWLDGSTTRRDKVVDAFQKGEAELFLVSLKAGGAGLTLTAADTVILYDPWWNPQVERQAMDRVHRIGQDKPVFTYRLVAEGTVEQTIHELQAKKQAISDALLDGGSTSGAALTQEDLDALFKPLGVY